MTIAYDSFSGTGTSLHGPMAGESAQSLLHRIAFRQWRLDISLLSSAARTATTSATPFYTFNARALLVWLNVTVASGTGGLQVSIDGREPMTLGFLTAMNTLPAAVTTTGMLLYVHNAGSGASVNMGAAQFSNIVLPAECRVRIIHGDASSYTYSVGATLVP